MCTPSPPASAQIRRVATLFCREGRQVLAWCASRCDAAEGSLKVRGGIVNGRFMNIHDTTAQSFFCKPLSN